MGNSNVPVPEKPEEKPEQFLLGPADKWVLVVERAGNPGMLECIHSQNIDGIYQIAILTGTANMISKELLTKKESRIHLPFLSRH